MKRIKRELMTVSKTLKLLTQKTEKMALKLEQLEKAATKDVKTKKSVAKSPAKSSRAKASKNKKAAITTKKTTGIDTVLAIIKRSKKGVDTAMLKKKTGFNERQIWSFIYRLKKQGKIKASQKGSYVKI